MAFFHCARSASRKTALLVGMTGLLAVGVPTIAVHADTFHVIESVWGNGDDRRHARLGD